jgi:hypothetical protein
MVDQQNGRNHTGCNGNQQIITADLYPVLAAWRPTQAVRPPVIDHVLTRPVIRRQSFTATEATCRAYPPRMPTDLRASAVQLRALRATGLRSAARLRLLPLRLTLPRAAGTLGSPLRWLGVAALPL